MHRRDHYIAGARRREFNLEFRNVLNFFIKSGILSKNLGFTEARDHLKFKILYNTSYIIYRYIFLYQLMCIITQAHSKVHLL